MSDYLKKNFSKPTDISVEEFVKRFSNCKIGGKKLCVALSALLVLFALISGFVVSVNKSNQENNAGSLITLAISPSAATSQATNLITIPTGTVKANPFLPYRDISGSSVSDVPQFDLVEPPETLNEGSDAARVMDTIVSGILYDKHSPSAIINIEGNDYLVKKGDVINNYKIIDITKDCVSVKLGTNIYRAGIGEILTEGSINYNEVSNLSKKFGGEKR